jgi:catechol 2,3-dioxygenase-like lactoylglutathione lyase family enzyme
MKTRCFDHIDLRVKDMEVARKFYGKILPQLGFVHESPGEDFHTFYAGGGDRPLEFFGFTEDKNHRPNGTQIAFWADTREEVDRIAKLVRDAGGKNLEGPEVCKVTARVTTPSFSKIPRATSWRFAAGNARSLRNDRLCTKS